MKTLMLVSSLWLAVPPFPAGEYVIGGVDLASSGRTLATFGWTQLQEPTRGHTLKGSLDIHDMASFARIAWVPYSVECTSNVNGVVSCQYQQNLVGIGSPGRCYRAALTGSAYTPTGGVTSSNSFGSPMICIPPEGDPTCSGDGIPIPTSAELRESPRTRPRSPSRRDPGDASRGGDPEAELVASDPPEARGPVTTLGAKSCGSSPILIDLENEGFPLSDVPVLFDLDADGKPEKTNWTAPGSGVALLVLDRDASGTIDSGLELFGNNTRLSTGEKAQYGYIALAEYDLAAFGGNFDGVIGPEDAVWAKLRLWVDRDHDGISRPGELLTLDQAGILKLEYDYTISRKQDRFGNRFLARGKAWRENRRGKPREVPLWDVWFVRP